MEKRGKGYNMHTDGECVWERGGNRDCRKNKKRNSDKNMNMKWERMWTGTGTIAGKGAGIMKMWQQLLEQV